MNETLVLLFEGFDGLVYLLDFHFIFEPALRPLDFVHKVDLCFLLELEDARDVLLIGVLPDKQKEDQFQQL